MADTYSQLDGRLTDFIKAQKIFFVATAPDNLKEEYVNVSPKGFDTLEILDSKTLFYADYAGSGNETAIHLQQNGKLTMMFVSFDKEPMTLRLYGRGEVVQLDSPLGKELIDKSGEDISSYVRQLILLHIERVKSSCGSSIPYYQYLGEREPKEKWGKRAALISRVKKLMGFIWRKK